MGSIIALILLLIIALPAWAADRYASTTGSGSTCSSGTPCSLNTCINSASPGDTCILKNGTYTQTVSISVSGTSGNPITIRAENRHQATIKMPAGVADNTYLFANTGRDYITVQGLVLNGDSRGSSCLRFTSSSVSNPINGAIVQDNRMINCGGPSATFQGTVDSILRYNEMVDAGLNPVRTGEGIYWGGNSTVPEQWNTNSEVYGNVVRNVEEGINVKSNTGTSSAHHNIITGMTRGTSGAISGGGWENVQVENNIVYDNPQAASGGSTWYLLTCGTGTDIQNNVTYNTDNVKNRVITWDSTPTGVGSLNNTMTNNTFCGLDGYTVNEFYTNEVYSGPVDCSGTTGSLTISGNTGIPGGAAQAVCDAERDRIVEELVALNLTDQVLPTPTVNNCEVGGVDNTTLVIVWDCEEGCSPPLSQISKDPNLVGSTTGAFTESGSVIVGSNTTHTTLSGAPGGAETLLLTVAADTVRNSADWGGLVNFANVAQADIVCTNHVTGGPLTPTITQANFRVVAYEDALGSTWRPGPGVAINTNDKVARAGAFVLAFDIEVTGGAAPTQGYRVKYSKNGGAYGDLAATCTAGNACAIDHESSGQTITVMIDDDVGLTNVPSKLGTLNVAIPNLELPENSETELRHVVGIDTAASFVTPDTFCFRVYTDSGAALSAYNNTPCIEVRPSRMIIGF